MPIAEVITCSVYVNAALSYHVQFSALIKKKAGRRGRGYMLQFSGHSPNFEGRIRRSSKPFVIWLPILDNTVAGKRMFFFFSGTFRYLLFNVYIIIVESTFVMSLGFLNPGPLQNMWRRSHPFLDQLSSWLGLWESLLPRRGLSREIRMVCAPHYIPKPGPKLE